ncbi:MAG: hypothetical protein HYV04_16910 [Deltaproteobacteria bacterium]|nr:hypothetical protein [Deltaproteobacteria bacterium]
MIFLIEYNRPEGRIITLKRFKDSERLKAENSRLEIELDLNRRGVDHEVVVLEAATEHAVRRTHRRYFEDLSQLRKSASGGDD